MCSLRPRKRKMDVVKQDSGFSDNLSDVNEENESMTSDSESEEDCDWFIDKRPNSSKPLTAKKNQNKSTKTTIEEKPFISEYERIRLQNIAERNELLRSMGINVQENVQPIKVKEPKRVKKEKENTPMRMSLRLRGKPSEKTSDSFMDESISKETESDIDTRNLERERWAEDEMEGREQFLEDLKEKISDINYDSDALDLTTCTTNCFRDVMLSMVVKNAPRVLNTRIQSLCVHPSSSKRIVFAGSKTGALSICDVDAPDNDGCVELQPNNAPINCITVDEFNPNEIYITSHEGTLTCADIYSKQFINIFATPYEDNINHITWHHQMDANTFLISHGNGSVLVVDKREKKTSLKVNCFSRSARTVQPHPKDTKYFLASSGAAGNGCGVYDMRTKKEVSHLDHEKGTTAAFFSHSAINIATTCNDDTVKIWDSRNLDKITLAHSFSHYNHTGRWLSVFKAQWYPGRDDIFHIGSLLNPRRIQMYTDKGKLLTELRSPEVMTTVQPVLAVHRTLPFVVGGNSSGRLHAFTPPN